MSSLSRWILGAALTVTPNLATAQLKIDRPVSDYTRPGISESLKRPGSVPFEDAMAPHFGGQPTMMPPQYPPRDGRSGSLVPISSPTVSVKALLNPMVGDDTVAIYNTSDKSLKFTLSINDAAPEVIQIAPRQIYFSRQNPGTKLSATITTGSSSSAMFLSLGAIYVLQAHGMNWAIAKF